MYLCVRYTHTQKKLLVLHKKGLNYVSCFHLRKQEKKNTRKQKIKPKSKRRNKDQMENEIIHTLFPI